MELAAIFTATPAEIDIEIARLENEIGYLDWRRELTVKTFLSEHSTTEEAAKAKLLNAELVGKTTVLYALLNTLREEYTRRGGWGRVYAVNNNNGHFHRTRACRNTYDTTEWIWMTELSGLTNAEVVDRTGKMSCLTCFADQREEIEKGREPIVFTPAQLQAVLKRAEAAEKAKKTAANAITNPDGTPLRGSDGVIKTLRTAWIEAVDELVWAEYSEDAIRSAKDLDDEALARHTERNLQLIKDHCEGTFRIATAIAYKTEQDLAVVLTKIVEKADAKIRRNRRLADISD